MSAERLRRRMREFHEGEDGQVTLLFVFASIGFVLMLSFIINSAQQTSRKIQMQNAADSAAVSGATWIARGMNLMAFDNKGMADIIGVMIDIRSVRQAAELMPLLVAEAAEAAEAGAVAAAIDLNFALAFELEELAIELVEEEFAFWIPFVPEAIDIDDSLNSSGAIGWTMLNALDNLNSTIATATPFVALADAIYYGHLNGLPSAVGGIAISTLPVMRGGKERMVQHANNEDYNSPACCLRVLEPATLLVVAGLCEAAAAPCVSFPIFILPFYGAIETNIGSLEGSYPQFLASILGALQWPDPPPEPMMLTDTGSPGDSPNDGPAPPVNLLVVRQRLQYLGGAWAPNKRNGIIGGANFVNPAPYGWLTYAEGDVYNIVAWDMFQQQWRAKLARASTLDQNFSTLTSKLGVNVSGWVSTSFVNNH